MYKDSYSDEITKKLAKLKKKDPSHYEIVRKKMDWLLENPEHTFKFLRYSMKGVNRIHIGSFVLAFIVDHNNKSI
ncbi:addiction module toxin RelE [Candidatus Woesearchaeota archaeon]|nr:addiction module toxin RelE [Candidatus Woesearchaeota archaeon]